MAFLFLLSVAAYVSAAPVAPVTPCAPVAPVLPEGARVGWVPNPVGRGTSKIIISCSVTLALCIWTAIHPDVVKKKSHTQNPKDKKVGSDAASRSQTSTPDTITAGSKESQPQYCDTACTASKRLRKRIFLTFKALLIPDEVLIDAQKQWAQASRLHKAMIAGHYILEHMDEAGGRGFIDKKAPPPAPRDEGESKDSKTTSWRGELQKWLEKHESISDLLDLWLFPSQWDLFGKEVAFFVVQGGFVRNSDRTLISPLDLYYAYMMDPQKLHEQIRAEDICDKGNASVLAKVIVCGQCGWFLITLLSRLYSNLSITFLELHVMIHIIAALVVLLMIVG
jgi:hypothetical protein